MNVLVIGAGVAGLAAAHELRARGYAVHVIEARSSAFVGGKARTQMWKHELGMLPGEHGYRFFPGFYRHAPELMARIPVDPTKAKVAEALHPYEGNNVAQHLHPSELMGIAYPNREMYRLPLKMTEVPPFERIWDALRLFSIMNPVDLLQMALRLYEFRTLCEERRDEEIEKKNLWTYMRADRLANDSQRLLQSVPRALVAMDAQEGSARTFLNTLTLMGTESSNPAPHRVLDGPTSEVWLRRWHLWLEKYLGVTFEFECEALKLHYDGGRITKVDLDGKAQGKRSVVYDHVVVATDVAATKRLVQEHRDHCHHIARLATTDVEKVTGTMSGCQIYLKKAPAAFRGHVSLPFSEWGISGLWQHNFWSEAKRAELAKQGIATILSVAVTHWNVPGGYHGKPAAELTREQICDEIEAQLHAGRNDGGEPLLDYDDIVACHLDDEVTAGPTAFENRARLLIHPPGYWQQRLRPESDIENLFFAGDHVATPIDLATMEGAIASACAVTKAILERDGRPETCVVHNVRLAKEDPFFELCKAADRARMEVGKIAELFPDQLLRSQPATVAEAAEIFGERTREHAEKLGVAKGERP